MDRSDSLENACPLCHDSIPIFAVGHCDHPVCYKCSTRMRVLCEQMDCPICRSAMPQVAFVRERKPFNEISLRECIPNRKNKIFYENEEIEDKYLDLLEFRCRFCPQRKPERTFAQLQTHMRREHQLFACDICLAHLKLFPYETKFYDRKFLAVHRRIGDEDDKSYKGHPLCEFCDTRYLDKDELMKHLRKDHFFCHFCDQECSNAYYNDYPDLLEHFKDSHFLCQEDECGNPSTRFTHAFSSDIDLKSHKASVHNYKSKEIRTIDVNFQFAPRRQGHSRSGVTSDDYEDSGSQRQRPRGDRYGNRRRQQEESNLQRALEASVEERNIATAKVPDPINDFPTLSGLPASQKQGGIDSQTSTSNPKKVDDFPTLGSTNGSSKKSQNPVQSSKNYAAITHFASSSQPVIKDNNNTKDFKPVSLGNVKGKNNDRWAARVPDVTDNDYPSLGTRDKPTARPSSASGGSTSSSWLQKSSVVEVPTPTTISPSISVVAERLKEPEAQIKQSMQVMKPISDQKEFPSLGGGGQKNENVSISHSWSKQKSSNKPVQKQKPKKAVDEFFELPDSCYKSYEQSEPPPRVKAKSESNPNKSSKKSTNINKRDFPGLPNRQVDNKPPDKEKITKDIRNESKQREPQKNASEIVKKSKKVKKGQVDNSLSDIAAGIMNLDTNTSKLPGKGKTKKTDENGNDAKDKRNTSKLQVSKPDWFDNPPSEKTKDKESVLHTDNSFPSLHAMPSSLHIPNAPPGFQPNHLPIKPDCLSVPPGFSKPAAPPGLSKPIFSPHDYLQPANFSNRNQVLVQNIRVCLETVKDGFDNFKMLSFQFRQGLIDAHNYYTSCQLLIGDSDFRNIFPELLALLPDINKQQELWFQHQVFISELSSSKSKKVNFRCLSPCLKCGQIVLKDDSQHHSLQHGDGEDFPSLLTAGNNGSNSNVSKVNGTWIKAT